MSILIVSNSTLNFEITFSPFYHQVLRIESSLRRPINDAVNR